MTDLTAVKSKTENWRICWSDFTKR